MPKTRINLGYQFYNSTNQYTLNSFKTSYGYVWKRSEQNENQFNLITINYVESDQYYSPIPGAAGYKPDAGQEY